MAEHAPGLHLRWLAMPMVNDLLKEVSTGERLFTVADSIELSPVINVCTQTCSIGV
ncbi:hypothetical protein OK016_13150 [Vibrio chagasii]|nr:hypothetical protein [Vibrio chagasii]